MVRIKLEKMTVFKSGIFLMFVFVEQSAQFSISSEVDSELPLSSSTSPSFTPTLSPSSNHNQTGCLKTIGQCFRQRPNELVACGLEHAINNIDCFIASNNTWQFNEFIALKKNADWKPSEIEARHDQTIFESVLRKLSDLIASRSIQFSIPPQNDELLTAEGRVKSGFDFDLTNYVGGGGIGPGKKKQSDFQTHISFSFSTEHRSRENILKKYEIHLFQRVERKR